MKNQIFLTILLCLAAFLQVFCQKNTEIIESTDDFRENAIHKISKLEYDIDAIALENFTDNLIFDGNGKVIGAMVEEIQASLEEKRYESFIQEVIKENYSFKEINSLNPRQPNNGKIFRGFKPQQGGCVKKRRWICILYGDVIQ